jgi:hypothetical protein
MDFFPFPPCAPGPHISVQTTSTSCFWPSRQGRKRAAEGINTFIMSVHHDSGVTQDTQADLNETRMNLTMCETDLAATQANLSQTQADLVAAEDLIDSICIKTLSVLKAVVVDASSDVNNPTVILLCTGTILVTNDDGAVPIDISSKSIDMQCAGEIGDCVIDGSNSTNGIILADSGANVNFTGIDFINGNKNIDD